jgi:hypothetical protein
MKVISASQVFYALSGSVFFECLKLQFKLFWDFQFQSFATPDVEVYYPLRFPISDKPFLWAGPPEPSS